MDPRPLTQNFSTSSTSSYLKFSHFDHGLWVYGLFKPCWLTHASWTCFKETVLLFNVHLSCLVNFILCPTDKYMFKVNKLVFGNCGSSIYYQNDQFRKCFLLFDTYVLINKKSITCSSQLKTSCFPILRGKTCFCSTKWCGRRLEANATLPPPPTPPFSLALYYQHIMNICFSSKFALRIPIASPSFLQAISSVLSPLFPRLFFSCIKTKTYLNHWNRETTW